MAKTELQRLYALKQSEQIRLEYIASYAIYLVPLIPALLSYYDMLSYITWGEVVPRWMIHVFGVIAGGILEFLGLATSHTFSAFQVHNRRAGKTQRVSTFWVIVAWVFYLAVMFTLNVGLVWNHVTVGEKLARTGLAFLSIPVFILVSVRSMHTQILLEKERARAERMESAAQEPEPVMVQATNGHMSTADMVREYLTVNNLSPDDVGASGPYSPADVAREIGAKPSTVRVALHRLRDDNGG